MRVLSVDTAGPVVGVGLFWEGQVTQRYERVRRGAEALLVPWAQELLTEVSGGFGDLDGVAVARGPGAFTGVRVGMATAAGWSLAANLPLWGCSSLVSRGVRACTGKGPVLSLLDARKGRVYASLVDADGTEIRGPLDVEIGEAIGDLGPGFICTGEGALVYAEAIQAAGGILANEADHAAVDVLSRLGASAIKAGRGQDPGHVFPEYVRQPDAKKTKDRN